VNVDTYPDALHTATSRPTLSSAFAEPSRTSRDSITLVRLGLPTIEPRPRSRRMPSTADTAACPSVTRLTSAITTTADGISAITTLYVMAAA
jgi:hypothetical protein